MILNTVERKEKTGDEVSDAAELSCLCLHAGKMMLPNNNKHEDSSGVQTCACVHKQTLQRGTYGSQQQPAGRETQTVSRSLNTASVQSER